MKYMLMIYGNPATWEGWSEQEHAEVLRSHQTLIKELTETGELIGSQGLTTAGARSVRLRNGVPAVTDGPYTEAKEMLAGYYLVDCVSVERATEIAARLPEARWDPIEVRRLMDPTEVGM